MKQDRQGVLLRQREIGPYLLGGARFASTFVHHKWLNRPKHLGRLRCQLRQIDLVCLDKAEPSTPSISLVCTYYFGASSHSLEGGCF